MNKTVFIFDKLLKKPQNAFILLENLTTNITLKKWSTFTCSSQKYFKNNFWHK